MLCWRLWGACLLLAIGSCVGVAQAQEANPLRAPVPSRPTATSTRPATAGSLPAGVFDTYLRVFQQVISPVDGPRSSMYPTGSAYARQAITKHGALLGTVLTLDRLMHEGNEEQVSRRIKKYGLWRVYDPVEANDWWWYGPDWLYTSVAPPLRR